MYKNDTTTNLFCLITRLIVIGGLNMLKWILAYIPQYLPQTESELEQFCTQVIELGPFEDSEAMRIGIAGELLQTDVRKHKMSIMHYVGRMKRVKSNATAYNAVAAARDRLKQEASKEAKDAANEILSNSGI